MRFVMNARDTSLLLTGFSLGFFAHPAQEATDEEVLRLRETVAQAKQEIARLRTALFGVRAETSQVVLDSEGQTRLPFAAEAQMAPPAAATAPQNAAQQNAAQQNAEAPATGRRARDLRGVAQRFPQLPIVEASAPLPPELQEQVSAGHVTVERTGAYTEQVVIERPKAHIRRVFQTVVRSTRTQATVLSIPAPEALQPGGLLADETIHHLVIAKFLDAMPFHRTLVSWERQHIEIARQTVNDAFTAWAETFKPLARVIETSVFHDPVVHVDDGWGRTKNAKHCTDGNIWVAVGDRQVAYQYKPGRRHAHAPDFIPAWFTGYLIRDGWSGWDKLEHIKQGGCLAHARRDFATHLKSNKNCELSQGMIQRFAEIYRIEAEANQAPPAERLSKRLALRQQYSRAIMDGIHAESQRICTQRAFSHTLAAAARYILNQWPKLITFLDNPQLPPDNNAAENALRINALIRKNSLFFGAETGGERAAIALTVLHSCRLAQVEPHAYLQRVTPVLCLHRRGRPQDLAAITPRTIANQTAT